MLLVRSKYTNIENLIEKYKDKIIYIQEEEFKGNSLTGWPINYIEAIKKSSIENNLTIIDYNKEIVKCLQALKIEHQLIYDETFSQEMLKESQQVYEAFTDLSQDIIVLNSEITLEKYLSKYFDWINYEEVIINKEVVSVENQEIATIPENKNKLTLAQLLDDNLEITEADVRDLKATQNKLKVGMLLQAKNSLNRVLKLSNILDKLYDELINRIDQSITITDTASLSYTTEYIAKALNDTNQFIVSLISNEKIQNFFIIDNSSVINVNNDRADIDKRERIRKAVEIVIDNLDYFEEGKFDKLKNPNIIEAVPIEEENSNDTTT